LTVFFGAAFFATAYLTTVLGAAFFATTFFGAAFFGAAFFATTFLTTFFGAAFLAAFLGAGIIKKLGNKTRTKNSIYIFFLYPIIASEKIPFQKTYLYHKITLQNIVSIVRAFFGIIFLLFYADIFLYHFVFRRFLRGQ